MRNFTRLLLFPLLFCTGSVHAQLSLSWHRYIEDSTCPLKPSPPRSYDCHGIITDTSGNIITASTLREPNQNFKIDKRAPDGTLLWTATLLDTLLNAGLQVYTLERVALFTDSAQDIYCAIDGSFNDSADHYSVLWSKLSPAGQLIAQHKIPVDYKVWPAIADSSGNLYFLESADIGNYFKITKISNQGMKLYTHQYPGLDNGVDLDGNLAYANNELTCSYFTFGYNPYVDQLHICHFAASTGALLWHKVYMDETDAVFADDGQAIYAGAGFYLKKYSRSGALIWRLSPQLDTATVPWPTSSSNDGGFFKPVLDDSSNIYTSTFLDYVSVNTIYKIDSSGHLLNSVTLPDTPGPIMQLYDMVYSKGYIYAIYGNMASIWTGVNTANTIFKLDKQLNVINTLLVPADTLTDEFYFKFSTTDKWGNLILSSDAILHIPDTALQDWSETVGCYKFCTNPACGGGDIDTRIPSSPGMAGTTLTLSPNPNSGGMMRLSYALAADDIPEASIIDQTGRVVWTSQKLPGSRGGNITTIDLSTVHLASGVYSFILSTHSGVAHRKLVLSP